MAGGVYPYTPRYYVSGERNRRTAPVKPARFSCYFGCSCGGAARWCGGGVAVVRSLRRDGGLSAAAGTGEPVPPGGIAAAIGHQAKAQQDGNRYGLPNEPRHTAFGLVFETNRNGKR